MRQYIDGSRVATKIKMLRSMYRSHCFLVVEGDTDGRLFGKFIDNSKCKIVIADNKKNVIDALKILNTNNFIGVLGIIDSDFDKIQKTFLKVPNICTTDTHDIETMQIKSHALEYVLSEYIDRIKFDEFISIKKASIRDCILEIGEILGLLRLYSIKENINFDFEKIDIEEFIDYKNFTIDKDRLIDKLIHNSTKRSTLNSTVIVKELNTLLNKRYDKWIVCNGHDLMSIILIGLQKVFGSYNTNELHVGKLQGDFRLAYEYSFFIGTNLYRTMLIWQNSNTPYVIFYENKAVEAS